MIRFTFLLYLYTQKCVRYSLYTYSKITQKTINVRQILSINKIYIKPKKKILIYKSIIRKTYLVLCN